MVATSEQPIIELSATDAADALPLSIEANWNQNEADWRFFLTAGRVFGIRDDAGRLVATAALLPYGTSNAWISMVLVTADWQRRGLATQLMNRCLDAAARNDLTIWLDATPAGSTVYGPLGFTPVSKMHRLGFHGQGGNRSSLAAAPIEDLIALDRAAMGFDRSAFLAELHNRPNARVVARHGAMALVRDGRKARHIGPVFADSADAAHDLVMQIAHGETGPILIDAADDARGLMQALVASGWTAQRPFQRMRLGKPEANTTPPAFVGAGPEFG